MATISHQQMSIKLLSECFIKPKHEIDATKQFYHLGSADIAFLSIDPIQKGLLYTLNNHTTSSEIHVTQPSIRTKVVSNLLENLKHSLSIALVQFYPLAGRFTTQIYPNEDACSICVDCNKGPGARFIHATALDVTVSDILSPIDVTIAHSLFDLGERYVNYDCHTKALLSIQVTELEDGVFIGFSMSHSVGDGTSFIHFISMLSEIYRSNECNSGSSNTIIQISRVPIFNYRRWLSYSLRPFLSATSDSKSSHTFWSNVADNKRQREYDFVNEDIPILRLPFVDVERFICRGYEPGPLRERIFHFSPNSMASLKAKANQEGTLTHNVISSFQALTALVWRSITRARSLPLDQQATCFLAIGTRTRFVPPISDAYFGNFLTTIQCACKVEELLSNHLGWAATNLHNKIRAQDEKAILEKYKDFAKSPSLIPRGLTENFHGANSVIIGGSSRFNMYEPEFGLGRAIAARMGFGNKEDGKITANPGCEGNGSVDLEICLRPHIMATLETDEEFMRFVLVT